MSPRGLGGCAEATNSSAWVRVCVYFQVCVCRSALSYVCVWRMSASTCVCWGGGVVVLCVTVCACFRVTRCFSMCVCVGGLYCRAVAVCDAVIGCI